MIFTEEKKLCSIQSQQKIQTVLSGCKNFPEFWAYVVREIINDSKYKKDEGFAYICSSVILSALVCSKLGTGRKYLEKEEDDWKKHPAVGNFRYLLHNAKTFLEQSFLGSKVFICYTTL